MRTVIVIPNLKYSRNYLFALRTAEAFGVTEIISTRRLTKKLVPSGAMSTYKHIKMTVLKSQNDIIQYLNDEKLHPICIENTSNAKSLLKFKFPPNIALILGHEKLGVPSDFIKKYQSIRIPQFGLVSCLNTSVALAIVLWERFKQQLKI